MASLRADPDLWLRTLLGNVGLGDDDPEFPRALQRAHELRNELLSAGYGVRRATVDAAFRAAKSVRDGESGSATGQQPAAGADIPDWLDVDDFREASDPGDVQGQAGGEPHAPGERVHAGGSWGSGPAPRRRVLWRQPDGTYGMKIVHDTNIHVELCPDDADFSAAIAGRHIYSWERVSSNNDRNEGWGNVPGAGDTTHVDDRSLSSLWGWHEVSAEADAS